MFETANRRITKIPPAPFRKGGVQDGFASLSLSENVLSSEDRAYGCCHLPEFYLTQSSSLPRRSPVYEDWSSLLSPNGCPYFDTCPPEESIFII